MRAPLAAVDIPSFGDKTELMAAVRHVLRAGLPGMRGRSRRVRDPHVRQHVPPRPSLRARADSSDPLT